MGMASIDGKVKYIIIMIIIRPVFFAVCDQANGFSQFKVDSICLPMFPYCGSFTIGPRRSVPYAKLSGTNLKIGTCLVKFLVKQSNGGDRAPPGVQGYGQRSSWLVESMKEFSRQQHGIRWNAHYDHSQ